MSDSNSPSSPDAVQQLLHGSNPTATPLTAEQRNDRREALLKRQREQREKAQQLSQTARANTSPASAASPTTPPSSTSTDQTPVAAPAAPATATSVPVAAAAPAIPDAPVRENMVQQAVSFLSSPSVQSADEAKKTQFLEKKGLTAKEIELARARIAGSPVAAASTGSAIAPSTPTVTTTVSNPGSNSGPAPPPVPPRNYAPVQGYPQQPVMYMQQQQQVVVDPNAFKRKLVIAMLISGSLTVFSSIIIQKLLYPMIRGITGARQSLVGSQTELLSKLKETLKGYKDYLLGMHLGSNRFTPTKALKETYETTLAIKDTKTTVEDEDTQEGEKPVAKVNKEASTPAQYQSTVKQLDAFSMTLENHAGKMSFEQLKATRAMTQDLAEYITKETYALTHSIAYPTSRYYGYNTAGAAASGKGGLADPTTPESALKSEIRSLKGLLLNWRNFPVAKEGASGGLPNLVQAQ